MNRTLGSRVAVRPAVLLLLLPLLAACAEESTAPNAGGGVTHRLVVHVAGGGDRAVAITFIVDSAHIAPVPSFRVFTHTFRGQVGIVALPDGPGPLPQGDVVVATVALSGQAAESAEPSIHQVATVEHELGDVEGYSARLEPVRRQ
jgi:hypothetical protein